jgi:hypothetical protein
MDNGGEKDLTFNFQPSTSNSWAAVLFVVACVGLRVACLPMDPPAWLSWSSGVYTDEGFYTLDARHLATFGKLGPGNFHDSFTAPLLSAMQTGWFHWFGTGLIAARTLPAGLSLATLLLFWSMLRLRGDNGVANVAVVLLGFAPPFLFYNCLALQETPALFWVVVSLWLIAAGAKVSPWPAPRPHAAIAMVAYAMAGAALVAAYACKPLAALAAPAVALFLWNSSKCDRAAACVFASGVLAGAAVYVVACWYPHHAEIARMSAYYAEHQMTAHSLASIWLNVRRALMGGQRGLLPYWLAFMPAPMLLAARAVANRRKLPIDPAPVVWLVCGTAFCALSSYAPSRYYVLFLPALCWVAALGWRGLPRGWQTAAMVLFFATAGYWTISAWSHRQATVLAAQAEMRSMPAGFVVVGEFAPELTMGSSYRSAPVQPGLDNDQMPVERLHADYVAVRHAPVWDKWWGSRYPALIRPSRKVATFALGDGGQYLVDIYRVH